MYDVVLFLLKLALFVCASCSSVLYIDVPEFSIAKNMQISSLQIVLCSILTCVYVLCVQILDAIRERRQYDSIDDVGVDTDEDAAPVEVHEAGHAASIETARHPVFDHTCGYTYEDGGMVDVPAAAVIFGSMSALKQHICLIHLTGFLVWNTVYALDYTQPDLAYCFTVGIATAWLLGTVAGSCMSGPKPGCRESVHILTYLICVTMLAVVNIVSEKIRIDTISCVLCGATWPCFFTKRSEAMCRRPFMVLHSVRASHVTCVLLCFSPLMVWGIDFDVSIKTACLVFVVQPIVKVMCLLIMCISIQTGHVTDLVIVLSVASCAQFLLLYPLDHTYQVLVVLMMSALLTVHVFSLCYKKRPGDGGPNINV